MAHPDITSAERPQHSIRQRFPELQRRGRWRALWTAWWLCVRGDEVQGQQGLGLWRGTALWLEEVVHRYYFSQVNALVYFGAAVLLVLLGMRRFLHNTLPEWLLIGGIALEALLLLALVVTLLFAPTESAPSSPSDEELRWLLSDLNELAQSYDGLLQRWDRSLERLQQLESVTTTLEQLAATLRSTPIPSTELIEALRSLTDALHRTHEGMAELVQQLERLNQQQLRELVQREVHHVLEELIAQRLQSDESPRAAPSD